MTSKLLKNLNGHSGCIIDLLQDEEKIFVSKKSSDKNYNLRLKKQCIRQSRFEANYGVYSPKVYNKGIDENGLFYFDMEYVQGKTLAQYSEYIKITEIADFIKCLFKSLYMDNSKLNKNPRTEYIFKKKIKSLKSKIKNNKIVDKAFEILDNFDWSLIYQSPCHGDLTLENILVTKDKKLYLIDFLDSFYNSWMIDVAKLLQDLELKWSFRHSEISPNRLLRLQVAKEALTEEILSVENGEEKLNAIYHILLLNVLRIFPYAHDDVTYKFLNFSTEKLINKLETEKIGAII